jgi:hypothetical protein
MTQSLMLMMMINNAELTLSFPFISLNTRPSKIHVSKITYQYLVISIRLQITHQLFAKTFTHLCLELQAIVTLTMVRLIELINLDRFVRFEVLTEVVMKIWDILPCSPLKVNQRFGGACRLHLQD